jgi:hypothetical protein
VKLAIYEIFDLVLKAPTKQEKIDILRKYDNIALRMICRMAFDRHLEWILPEGDPPYKPTKATDVHSQFYNEVKHLPKFFAVGNPYPPKPDKNSPEAKKLEAKREQWFIDILEALMPKDAEILLAVKSQKLPSLYRGLTKKLIEETWPGLF